MKAEWGSTKVCAAWFFALAGFAPANESSTSSNLGKLSSQNKTMQTPMNELTCRSTDSGPILVRHEGHTPRERSACGWRDRLISRKDAPLSPAAWAHVVDIDGATLHYHKRSTELYYVLEGTGTVILDGVEHRVSKGSLIHIPPGVVHGARGRVRVLVVGIPDIAEDDYFEAPQQL